MYILSLITDKCWQCSLAEEESGPIKQLQLKNSWFYLCWFTSFCRLAYWQTLIGTWEMDTHWRTHTHTHTRSEPADCQMCHNWGQRRALQTLARGEGKQLLRAGSGKHFSVQPWWGKHGYALSAHLLKLHLGRKKETFSHGNARCAQNLTIPALKEAFIVIACQMQIVFLLGTSKKIGTTTETLNVFL